MWNLYGFMLFWNIIGLKSDINLVRNAALKKPAIQSSTFRDSPIMFGARLANDDSPLTCSKTKWSWTLFWRVDLQEVMPVGGANFTLRWEYFGRGNRFLYRIELQVGQENVPVTPTCGAAILLLDRADNFPVEIICERTTLGRFVTINIEPHYAGTVSTGSPQLTLCDVQIFSLLNATADNMAASHLTESVVHTDPEKPSELLQFATNTPPPATNNTNNGSQNKTSKNEQHVKKLVKEPGASSRFGKILQKMPAQTTKKRVITTTTGTTKGMMVDDLPVERTVQAQFDDELLYQLQSMRQDVTGKLISVYNYVVFSGAAIAILLILTVIAGILFLWRYSATRPHLAGSARSTILTQDFSCKAPTPPMTQLQPLPLIPPSHTRHLPRPSHQFTAFPKNSVPKPPNRSF